MQRYDVFRAKRAMRSMHREAYRKRCRAMEMGALRCLSKIFATNRSLVRDGGSPPMRRGHGWTR
eukprot:8780896-Alexandrium_andersonii.AAC.1